MSDDSHHFLRGSGVRRDDGLGLPTFRGTLRYVGVVAMLLAFAGIGGLLIGVALALVQSVEWSVVGIRGALAESWGSIAAAGIAALLYIFGKDIAFSMQALTLESRRIADRLAEVRESLEVIGGTTRGAALSANRIADAHDLVREAVQHVGADGPR